MCTQAIGMEKFLEICNQSQIFKWQEGGSCSFNLDVPDILDTEYKYGSSYVRIGLRLHVQMDG
jgi:hypothetical protein